MVSREIRVTKNRASVALAKVADKKMRHKAVDKAVRGRTAQQL